MRKRTIRRKRQIGRRGANLVGLGSYERAIERPKRKVKTVRFSKVVAKSGKPEVYLLMSETDPIFRKALESDRIVSLSGDAHHAGPEWGIVGYEKKHHGQLLLFPKSLRSFANAKIIGIKYDLFADAPNDDQKPSSPRSQRTKKAEVKSLKTETPAKPAAKKTGAKPVEKKIIPFPAKKVEKDNETGALKAHVRQAMKALEKGNSVAAYNILKRMMQDA